MIKIRRKRKVKMKVGWHSFPLDDNDDDDGNDGRGGDDADDDDDLHIKKFIIPSGVGKKNYYNWNKIF